MRLPRPLAASVVLFAVVLLLGASSLVLVVVPGGPAAADPAPTPDPDTSQIELVSRDTRVLDGVSYRWSYYRNDAYECAAEGHFTFAVLERASAVGLVRPLWTFMHGGGVGYFEADGTYHGDVRQTDEETSADLYQRITSQVLIGGDPNRPKSDSTMRRRLAEGYRVMVTSMCDHDLYAGLGSADPGDTTNPDNTVDGNVATVAALQFTALGNDADPGYPTGRVYLHGGSAGSAGSYHVAQNLSERGIVLNGIVSDSGMVHTRFFPLFEAGVLPQNDDPEWDQARLQVRIGPYLNDESLLIENTVAAGWEVPVFQVFSTNDPHCGGEDTAIPEAIADGFTGAQGNCRWVADLLQDSIAEAGTANRHRVHVEVNGGHVVTRLPERTALHDGIDDWIADNLASGPLAPFGFVGFTDVGPDHPFLEDITWLAASEVTTGYEDGSFRPATGVNRQQLAAFLYRMAGEPTFAEPALPTFSDVSAAHPFFAEIEWLAAEGIAEGFDDGTFRSTATLTRGPLAALLHRFAGAPEVDLPDQPSFPDVSPSYPFYGEVEWLAGNQITTGYDDGTFRPTATVNRQQLAAFLHRLACTPEAWADTTIPDGVPACAAP